MELTKTHLKYLLALYRLSQKRPDLPSMEVARLLGVSKPSVVRMLEVLMEQGLAVKARYGKIYLTDTGFLMAKRLSAPLERYAAQLQQEFSLSDDEAWNAACAAGREDQLIITGVHVADEATPGLLTNHPEIWIGQSDPMGLGYGDAFIQFVEGFEAGQDLTGTTIPSAQTWVDASNVAEYYEVK